MSAAVPFSPAIQFPDTDNRPDQLADAVLGTFSRTRWGYFSRPWGLLKTAILAAISFGLIPLIIWPRRFAILTVVEEQQFWHLAEWLRLRTGRPEAAALRDQSLRLGPSVTSRILFLMLPILAILLALPVLFHPMFTWPMLWHAAYGRPHEIWREGPYSVFWRRWTLVLTVGYFLHWAQVCRHAADVRKFIAGVNQLTAAEGVRPVRVAEVGVGFAPMWMLLAFVAAWRGAYWAIPMALAGVAHRRYVWITMRQMRADLARRVRGMLLKSRPALQVRAARCVNSSCRAFLKPGSVFCPRCGTRVPQE